MNTRTVKTISYSAIEMAGILGMGPFKLIIEEDGGIVCGAQIETGFAKRGFAEILPQLSLIQFVNYTDRLDYNGAPAYSLVSAIAIEKILHMEVPERAQIIRVILVELSIITSHLMYLAQISKTIGLFSIANYCLREREKLLDVFEMISGSRLAFGAICLGGVSEDATDGWLYRIEKTLDSVRALLPELNSILIFEPCFVARSKNLHTIDQKTAIQLGLRGPNLRASGIKSDKRRDDPYLGYKKVLFAGEPSSVFVGDVWSRVKCRVTEIEVSAGIITQLITKIPVGNFRVKVGSELETPVGKCQFSAEGARGEINLKLETGSAAKNIDFEFESPSDSIAKKLSNSLIGLNLEDIMLALQSFDICFSEVDK